MFGQMVTPSITRRAFDGSDLQLQHQLANEKSSRNSSTCTSSAASVVSNSEKSSQKDALKKKRANQVADLKERNAFFRAAGAVFSLKG
ncbi:hypothetical protein BGW36DRAFT_368375 [Talaromyces proteolyticus]|uniref:Uncharacterized protein n=1 Tax=Talaromyces proteolyticus TaxID=1131652 RepID=A0AAD4L6B2_9EURO|nr:uncharacterized protein BGW36DRAFT_368375 [Talaromyces proteolyticus]KAH8705916.1 hypothetical protein BGW36DRAFT_368375 [Talaromyces proteolyticus]